MGLKRLDEMLKHLNRIGTLALGADDAKAKDQALPQGLGLVGAAGIVAITESAIAPTNFGLSPGRQILADAGIDYDKEMKEMQREPEKQALEELAKPRKRKIRKIRP